MVHYINFFLVISGISGHASSFYTRKVTKFSIVLVGNISICVIITGLAVKSWAVKELSTENATNVTNSME